MRSSSSSNLFGTSNSTENLDTLLCRKRKTTDDDLHAMFASFSKTITDQLSGLKSEIDASVSSINANINSVIKSDLQKLTVSTSNIKSDLASMRTEYKQLKGDLSNLQAKQQDLTSEVSSIQTSLTSHTNQHGELSKQVKILTSDMKDLTCANNEIRQLKLELNTMQQRDRLNNIEIAGLPESKFENLQDIFCKLATSLGVSMSAGDIVQIHRVQPMTKAAGRPKTVIVKCTSSLLRDSIISAARKNKGLTTASIGLPGDAKTLFINEHLTPYNRLLHKKAREAAKLKHYQFVWIRDGKVFCRKEDKTALIRIREESDLKLIV